ncbi:hypothetical protein JCM8547_001643 [Rhodosporidiobolus lusitaniae]
MGLFRLYLRLLQRYTLPVQMATAATTSASGDLLYQTAFEKKGLSEIEWYKTKRLAFYGAVIWAPISNRWHATLAKIELSSKLKTTLARTAIDLSLFSPFATCLFYFSQGTMEGRPFRTPVPTPKIPEPPQGIRERLEERLWPTVQKQWIVFGPTGAFSFLFIPVYGRPPFMNLISLGWNCFLASAQARGGIPPPGHQPITGRDLKMVAGEAMS